MLSMTAFFLCGGRYFKQVMQLMMQRAVAHVFVGTLSGGPSIHTKIALHLVFPGLSCSVRVVKPRGETKDVVHP